MNAPPQPSLYVPHAPAGSAEQSLFGVQHWLLVGSQLFPFVQPAQLSMPPQPSETVPQVPDG